MKGVDPTISSPHEDATNAQKYPSEDSPLVAEPILSPLSAPSDLDSFSVISDIDVDGSQTPRLPDEVEVLTSPKVPDCLTNASDRLTSLVQRYHALCHTISTLRDGINKQAEAMNATALEKFEHTKMRLAASRGKAQEIVEGMKKANDGNVYVRLPWVDDGLVLPVHRNSTNISEMGPHSVTSSPIPAPRVALHFENDVKDGNLSSRSTKCDSQGLLTPPPTAHPHSPCFDKYEKMMKIIQSRLPGDLWPWDIPWPVLPRSVHNFPVKSSHFLLARDVVGNSIKKFVESYASWKAHPIHRVRATMLIDWTSIVEKTPVWRAGQKEMAELVAYHLSDSV